MSLLFWAKSVKRNKIRNDLSQILAVPKDRSTWYESMLKDETEAFNQRAIDGICAGSRYGVGNGIYQYIIGHDPYDGSKTNPLKLDEVGCMPEITNSKFYEDIFELSKYYNSKLTKENMNADIHYTGVPTNTKKQIGWKLKEGMSRNDSTVRNLQLNNTFWLKNGFEFMVNSGSEMDHKDSGILTFVFDPVYEVEKKKVQIKYYDSSNVIHFLDVEIVNGLAKVILSSVDTIIFSREELCGILNIGVKSPAKYRSSSFDFGCSLQYKNISREDIQKVINAL